MSRESWGFRERRNRGQTNRGDGRGGDRGERNRMWMNRFEVLDRTGEVDDTQEIVDRSTPVRVSRENDRAQEVSGVIGGARENENVIVANNTAVDEVGMEDEVRGTREEHVTGRKRTVEERSPEQRENVRVNRASLDEFDLGKMCEEINKKIYEGTRVLIDKAPESYKKELGAGLDLLLEGMREIIMNGVSDKVALERRKREAGEMDIEDKLDKLKEEVKGIKEVNSDVVKETIKDKIRSSEREMERKVRGAMCNLKILDFDFGGKLRTG
jgi:hypothetical protein